MTFHNCAQCGWVSDVKRAETTPAKALFFCADCLSKDFVETVRVGRAALGLVGLEALLNLAEAERRDRAWTWLLAYLDGAPDDDEPAVGDEVP